MLPVVTPPNESCGTKVRRSRLFGSAVLQYPGPVMVKQGKPRFEAPHFPMQSATPATMSDHEIS